MLRATNVWCLILGVVLFLACSTSPAGPGEAPGMERAAAPDGQQDAANGDAEAPAEPPAEPPADDLLSAELSTVGWDQLSGSPVVLLRELDSGQILPIWIGMAEARAISFELHGIEVPRPMTHDLMTNVIGQLGARLEEVVVSDLREGTYYGLLKLRVEGEPEPRWIDTRPSDGLALALRADARIRVARKLIEELPDYDFMAPDSPDQVVQVLGLTVVAPNEKLREELSLPDRRGLVVIAASGEAERQGLARGDLIVGVDGRALLEPVDLLDAIERSTGSEISVTYLRDGEEATVALRLGFSGSRGPKNVA
ncbi:MAG: PDZ domain-containing protein [bacterium]|nr:PDZ domain-containing protein [bacterium]